MLKRVSGSLILLVSSFFISTTALAENPVFLLGKLNIQGTTYTKVVFFYDRAVTDIKTCEREIYLGRMGQWQYYGHVVHKGKGLSANMNYFCRTSSYNISAWHPAAGYDYIYQLDMRENDFKVKPFESYAKCLGDLRKSVPDETHEFFCARANQEVTQPPTNQ
ncbi:hypothetical protein [Ketobacter sp.]|uniref:hypothetical protein n=1 Tax=Ketobacter sp. TaxID=2083498 RepID=UPI000F1FB038|nr:hypothetical protein [Ketobacter sp.]RLT93055.1 MAG: hypothetical protein D9N14_19565 [Ketobacter sp.]